MDDKKCPEDKILNPKTKRCVLKTSKIGKELLKIIKGSPKKETPENKILNPKTKRYVLKTSKIGKELIKNKKIIEKHSSSSSMTSMEKEKLRKLVPNKSSSLKSYSYKNNIKRFDNYKLLMKFLNEINLKTKGCITLYKNNNYLLGDKILLYKQIGSPSVYGMVYKCKYIDVPYELPKITVKIQLRTSDATSEIKTLEAITKFAIKNKMPNLPISYRTLVCNNIIKDDRYPKVITKANNRTKNYNIILNELASGDLNMFLLKYKSNFVSEAFWKNLYEQLYISLVTLHSLGISHNDSHGGNFLYHKIKPGGCFHYDINGIDFYIENIGFLWTTWDYGISRNLYNHCFYVNDYMLVNTILRKNDINIMKSKEYKEHPTYRKRSWGYLPAIINIPENIQKLQDVLFTQTGRFHKFPDSYLFIKKLTEDLWLKYLLDNNYLFSNKPIGEIISSVKINIPKTDFKRDLLYDKDHKHLIIITNKTK